MMKIPFLDLGRQYADLHNEVDVAIKQVIADNAFVGGRYVDEFEHAFARFCGARHCVGVANGTDALFLALRGLGVGPGDEVIVPAFTFIASAEAVTLCGAKVVFADVDPSTYTLDVKSLSARITPATRAVVPVHLYGQPANMDGIMEVAARHGLVVVEDAAQAHGAAYNGRTVGSMGHAGCFSFYPGKNLGAYGDGGAVVTNDDKLARAVRQIANHGRSDKYNHDIEGVNSRLDGLQAAILSVKLARLLDWNAARRAHAGSYTASLSGTGVVTPMDVPGTVPVYHLYVIRTRAEARGQLIAFLQSHGISTGIHYPVALPNLRAYSYLEHSPGDFPEATRAAAEVLSLPMFAELTDEELGHVCNRLSEFASSQSVAQINA